MSADRPDWVISSEALIGVDLPTQINTVFRNFPIRMYDLTDLVYE